MATKRPTQLRVAAVQLDCQGEDFYNAFALATPGGEIAGRVRKSPAASVEAYFYRSGHDAHVIETALPS